MGKEERVGGREKEGLRDFRLGNLRCCQKAEEEVGVRRGGEYPVRWLLATCDKH